jgi:hypothetical protein
VYRSPPQKKLSTMSSTFWNGSVLGARDCSVIGRMGLLGIGGLMSLYALKVDVEELNCSGVGLEEPDYFGVGLEEPDCFEESSDFEDRIVLRNRTISRNRSVSSNWTDSNLELFRLRVRGAGWF